MIEIGKATGEFERKVSPWAQCGCYYGENPRMEVACDAEDSLERNEIREACIAQMRGLA